MTGSGRVASRRCLINQLVVPGHAKLFPGVPLDSCRIGAKLLNLLLERGVFFFLPLDAHLETFILTALLPVRKQAVRAENSVKHQRGHPDHDSQRYGFPQVLAHPLNPIRRFAGQNSAPQTA